MTFLARILCLLALLAGCGGGGGSGNDTPPPPSGPADLSLLFMGNSHTLYHDVPSMVAAMVRAARPARTVAHTVAPGSMFLGERASDPATLALLRDRTWSFVVLQAQEYSSSGQFTYPTDGAEELVRLSRAARAVPILFPEWPRRGIAETSRIFELHASIARKQAACVPPIPQSFDRAAARYPALALHDADGNHSSTAGAFLAALVIAVTITGTPADALPDLPQLGVDAATQAQLRGIAAETVAAVPPRQFCPGDPFAP